jgi:hypothetical protein
MNKNTQHTFEKNIHIYYTHMKNMYTFMFNTPGTLVYTYMNIYIHIHMLCVY